MKISKLLLLAASVFIGGLGMIWLLEAEIEIARAAIVAIAVSGGAYFAEMYRNRSEASGE
ncbi:hypothetical protein [Aurantiacibacter odishensis]|uniref:hypothetical protein n=1 Tax=Aurantiacibacter odishensis TaxID=1155476 RepID=UPI0013C4DC93|nr:hypothetical protein [Aurantiacibacter odishensis]